MPRLKTLVFIKIGLKVSFCLQKNSKTQVFSRICGMATPENRAFALASAALYRCVICK